MNRKQKIVLAVGVAVLVLVWLFPPWYFPATHGHGGYSQEARFDAFRWAFSDRERDIGERFVARVMGKSISRPDLPMMRFLGLADMVLTMLAFFLLRTRSLFRCKRSGAFR